MVCHHSMRLQQAAQCLQILENTTKVSESWKHSAARNCSALLPIRFRIFAPGPCSFCAPNVVRAQRTCTANFERGISMKLTKANIGKIVPLPSKAEIIAFDDDIPGF